MTYPDFSRVDQRIVANKFTGSNHNRHCVPQYKTYTLRLNNGGTREFEARNDEEAKYLLLGILDLHKLTPKKFRKSGAVHLSTIGCDGRERIIFPPPHATNAHVFTRRD